MEIIIFKGSFYFSFAFLMNIKDVHTSGGCHIVILGAGASIAATLRDPELNGLKLPSMNNLPDVVGLNGILNQFPQELICQNFEATYSNIVEYDPNNPYLKVMNDMIYSYFQSLELPMKPTIYDYLVMSLRDKDIIATFNWDPFLYQAWWRNYLHGSSPQLVFLHGNVAVGYNEEHNMMGRAGQHSRDLQIYFEPTPLLYPVKHKDYTSSAYIKAAWNILQERLDKEKCNTHNITIFGYSAPVSDVEALGMMKKAWGDVDDRDLEQIELIDIREEEEVRNSWDGFIHTHHYNYCTSFFESSLALYPRRTDEAFFCHYLPLTPEEAFVEDNRVPDDFQTFEEMWAWYEPLFQNE